MKRLLVVRPHGFCSGVSRAVAAAETLLDKNKGKPVWCLHEIVHNEQIVRSLTAKGMVFAEQIEEIPQGATVLFSAHGVSPEIRQKAKERQLAVVNATCPFVEKVHEQVRRLASNGTKVLYIGHHNHVEVLGVAGEAPEFVQVIASQDEAEALDASEHPVAVATQTTLATEQVEKILAVLRRKFPTLAGQRNAQVCYATRNRQLAVRELAKRCTHVLVLGSRNSSNSRRLVESAIAAGCTDARLVSEKTELPAMEWPTECVLGVTSGASTPEFFLEETLEFLAKEKGFSEPEFFDAVQERECAFKPPIGAEP